MDMFNCDDFDTLLAKWKQKFLSGFVTETVMKEYDMDWDLWLISHFRCRQIDRNCVVPYMFPFYTHLFLLKEKK